jgi:hypothetical protein
MSRIRSFGHALAGIAHVIRTQRNAWIHAVMTVLVIGLGLWLTIPLSQWPLLLLAVALVWMAEFINSALEAIVDLASPGRHPLARGQRCRRGGGPDRGAGGGCRRTGSSSYLRWLCASAWRADTRASRDSRRSPPNPTRPGGFPAPGRCGLSAD